MSLEEFLYPFKKEMEGKTYVIFNSWTTLAGVWYLAAEIDPDEEIGEGFREFDGKYIFEPKPIKKDRKVTS